MPKITKHHHNDDSKKPKRYGLKTDINKYLSDKLAKELSLPNIRVPWAQIKAKDILNWPADVRCIPVWWMQADEVKTLHKLVKENALDFSPQFLKSEKSKLQNPSIQGKIGEIETVLCKKLDAGTNKRFRHVPWNMMRKEDIINWPEGIPLQRLSKHRRGRLKLLHKLREEISFSEAFLQRLSSLNQASIRQFIISDKALKKGQQIQT
jgi:hypothetical protein